MKGRSIFRSPKDTSKPVRFWDFHSKIKQDHLTC